MAPSVHYNDILKETSDIPSNIGNVKDNLVCTCKKLLMRTT
jgi:hypothetical protein